MNLLKIKKKDNLMIENAGIIKNINDFKGKILLGDCLEVMNKIPNNSVDLIFTDPPYNIGVDYENHEDNMQYEEYIHWCEKWLKQCRDILTKKGSIYVAINDEYAAEYVMIMKKLGLFMRNWIIWHYSFGQATTKKFSRCHTHILYFCKDKNEFIFNKDAIRVFSVRQKMGDKRAHPKGKIPEDVWKVSRVAGTFKERIKEIPNQMPIKILERIVKTSSEKKSIIMDPFSGSGTTLLAAKKLGREYVGIEKSKTYRNAAIKRLNSVF